MEHLGGFSQQGSEEGLPLPLPRPRSMARDCRANLRVPFILLASVPIPTAAQDSRITSQGPLGLEGAPLPLPCGASPHIPRPYFLWSSVCLGGSPSPEWKVQEGWGLVYFV